MNLAAFGPDGPGKGAFPPYGDIVFPYRKFGPNISSLDLFGNDEQAIFNFYWKNRVTYKHAVDIGANIGLHSLMMAKCGFDVWAFEPDVNNRDVLHDIMRLNDIGSVDILPYAVSDKWGEMEFISVKDNTTGSHIAGYKPNPYGELGRTKVKTWPISMISAWADMIKMDAEGHEAVLIESIKSEEWNDLDVIAEVHSMANAERITSYVKHNDLKTFAMNGGKLKKIPSSPKGGHVFITRKDALP